MTEETSRKALQDAGVPSSLLDFWRDPDSPLGVLFWSRPDFERAEALERRVPDLAGICPIAEQHGEAVIGLLPKGSRFIRYHYEDAAEQGEAIDLLGVNYQQFAASVLLEFMEAGLEEEFTEAAALLRFERLAELRALLDADPYDDDAVERFRSQL